MQGWSRKLPASTTFKENIIFNLFSTHDTVFVLKEYFALILAFYMIYDTINQKVYILTINANFFIQTRTNGKHAIVVKNDKKLSLIFYCSFKFTIEI